MDPYHAKPTGESYDEYGNPIHHGTGTGTGTGFGGAPLGGTGTHDQYQPARHDVGHGVTGGVTGGGLRRSGSSSSSSSSEDDGQGGRRKKGIKDKVKEKMPGHKDAQQSHAGATTAPGGVGGEGYVDSSGQYHEKKGMMEKIKEKLPGGHQ